MITYQEETVDDVINDIKPLLEEHYTEIARHQDKIALNPDYDVYYNMEKLGFLHIVTARDDGELVGYFISAMMANPHYKDHMMAKNDLMYVAPSHRGRLTAPKMIMYAIKQLKDKGVSVLHTHIKTEHDYSSFLERMGFVEIEKVHEYMLI